MAPLLWRVLLLAVGASCVRLHTADDANTTKAAATGWRASKRRRTGSQVARAQTGRSYVYVAGVPGTGLDYWQAILRQCVAVRRCEPRELGFYTGLLRVKESRVQEAWVKGGKQHGNRIVPMNLVSPNLDRQPDDWFHRAFSNRLSGDEDPRLPLYFNLAQRNGDSLKVVVLTRSSAPELLAYNMKKFKMSAEQAEDLLAADIRTLASQVQALPVDSYRCMRLEDVASLSEDMKPLVRLETEETHAFALKLRQKVTRDKYGCRFSGKWYNKKLECPRAKFAARKVRAALDTLEELCDPEDFKTKSKSGLPTPSGKKIQWLVE
uniref:Sulfotransferase domain-containing protein n=1 Tax=Alexandrium monilatum TaxID=311494 RepID=A0A7S4VUU7_9DINO